MDAVGWGWGMDLEPAICGLQYYLTTPSTLVITAGMCSSSQSVICMW